MKKLLSIILICIFCFSSIQVYAMDNSKINVYPDKIIGKLISDTGESIPVIGNKVYESNNSILNNMDENSATYMFELYSTRGSSSLTTNDTDGSISVRAYLTIKYVTKNEPTEYLLTNVSGYWNILDDRVSVKNAELVYGCSGVFPSPTTQTDTKTVNNYFNYNTGFTNYIIRDYGVMGANLTLDLKMGTRQWDFFLENNLF